MGQLLMSALGQKQTLALSRATSALCQKATSNVLLDRFLKSIKSRAMAGNTDEDLKTNLYSLRVRTTPF
jgi:spore coat protein U-like protein